MSDHDAAPDPIDKAYAQADAVLSDDEARAARRARVLAAVARELATPPAAASPSMRRPAWRRGGWLVAASVAGLGLFVATQIYEPVRRQPLQTAPPPAPVSRSIATSPAPSTAAPSPPLETAPRTIAVAPPAATPSPPEVAALPPPPPLELPPAPKAPPPPPRDVVITGERRAPAPAANDAGLLSGRSGDNAVDAQNSARRAMKPSPAPAFAPAPPPPMARLEPSAGLQPEQPAASLRAAAAAGRTAKIEALLAQGVPVDAPDADGDTALMKSVQADQPAAAALLRRHGASPDHRNRAGESARDMAAAKGDAELIQAIGLGP